MLLLTRLFSTKRDHLRYKQLAKVIRSFYADYLKSEKKSFGDMSVELSTPTSWGSISLFPCENKTSENTGRSLRHFIELVRLPCILH